MKVNKPTLIVNGCDDNGETVAQLYIYDDGHVIKKGSEADCEKTMAKLRKWGKAKEAK